MSETPPSRDPGNSSNIKRLYVLHENLEKTEKSSTELGQLTAVVAGAIELAMTMSITQDTFDEVVKESIEDFGMDRKGAAEHFAEKFKAHGKVGYNVGS